MDYLQKALAHFNLDKPQWYGWKKDYYWRYKNVL